MTPRPLRIGSRPAQSRSVMGTIKTSTPRIRRLLVPLDFSGKSRQALLYAVPMAKKFGAKIVLLHVTPTPVYSQAEMPIVLQIPGEDRKAVRKRLEATAAQLIPRDQYAGSVMLTGNPGRQILGAAGKHDIDLIVLSTTGRSGLKRMLLGSTAEYIVRHATCPVLSVRRR